MSEHIYTTRQVAKIKELNVWQVQYHVRAGNLVPDVTVGRDYLFLESTVNAWSPPYSASGRKPRPLSFEPDMLTLREVARRLGTSVQDVKAKVARGELGVDGKRSGVRYVRKETLEGL